MTTREAITALLPKVRDEIRQLQELEAALSALVGAPAPVATESVPLIQLQASAPVPVPAPPAPPKRLVVGDWTNSERRAAALHLLRMRGPLRVAEIARELDAAQGHVQTDMEALLKSGHVARVEHGTYAAVDVVWSGTDRAPLVDAEAGAFAQRSA